MAVTINQAPAQKWHFFQIIIFFTFFFAFRVCAGYEKWWWRDTENIRERRHNFQLNFILSPPFIPFIAFLRETWGIAASNFISETEQRKQCADPFFPPRIRSRWYIPSDRISILKSRQIQKRREEKMAHISKWHDYGIGIAKNY